MQKIILGSFLLLLSAVQISGQGTADKKLIKKIDQMISASYHSVAPGCAVLIAKRGEVVYKKAFGLANLELNVAMQPDMVFRIASMTKQYTAIAILKLIEEKRISLDDSVQKFVKDYPNKGRIITIEHLLTHTSGIPGYDGLDAHIPNAIRIDFTAKQIIDSLAVVPLDFIPGTKYNYSNTNYFLLGQIIEQVSGKKYKDYLEEQIFKPTGLFNTYYDSPSKIILNRVSGYVKDNPTYRNADYISMNHVFSAGALLSNVTDLYKWHMALYSGRLIKTETLTNATSPFKLSDGGFSEYGYGWFIKDFYGSASIGHGGAIDGFRSMEMYFPGQDLFITMLVNAESDNFFTFFENVTSLLIGNTVEGAYQKMEIENTVLDSYSGSYTFEEDTTQYIKIYKKEGKLYADLSNKTGMSMVLRPQSATLFSLPDVKRVSTTIEFIIEDKKVKELYWTQEKKHLAKKK